MLIGSDHPIFYQVSKEVIGSRTSDPIARITNLGWVCFGQASLEKVQKSNSRFHPLALTSVYLAAVPKPSC